MSLPGRVDQVFIDKTAGIPEDYSTLGFPSGRAGVAFGSFPYRIATSATPAEAGRACRESSFWVPESRAILQPLT